MATLQLHLFDGVADLVRAMTPEGLGRVHQRVHRRGIKVWIGGEKPTREHYEAQFISHRHLDPATEAADGHVHIELGFHAEHADEAANQACLDHLAAHEKTWRKKLAGDVEAGAFLGRDSWRRVSEVWREVDPLDPDLAFEIAGRLVDYLAVIEPIRQRR